jgi:ppGpp synthetase/RelA/SpoT-type nucleotidyltranferase
VIPRVDGHPIEIQVRTPLQDLWAQTIERLADRVGRAIRYGERPVGMTGEIIHTWHRFVAIETTSATYDDARSD